MSSPWRAGLQPGRWRAHSRRLQPLKRSIIAILSVALGPLLALPLFGEFDAGPSYSASTSRTPARTPRCAPRSTTAPTAAPRRSASAPPPRLVQQWQVLSATPGPGAPGVTSSVDQPGQPPQRWIHARHRTRAPRSARRRSERFAGSDDLRDIADRALDEFTIASYRGR
jgi:hypothetical protein